MKKVTTALFLILFTVFTASCANEAPQLTDFLEYKVDFSKEFIVVEKKPDEAFTVLNLSDSQLTSAEWHEGTVTRDVIIYTLNELINRIDPDMITLSGDLAWAEEIGSYRNLAEILDGYGIPWAPVWGNHDNEKDFGAVDRVEMLYSAYKNCIYQAGDPNLGNGNYIISIQENGAPITGIFMVDSHNTSTYIGPDDVKFSGYSTLNDDQRSWYGYGVENMKDLGYKDSMIIMHIPIFAYKTAFEEAFNSEYDPMLITWEESSDDKYWNEGYESSFGVHYKPSGTPPVDDGMFELIKNHGHTSLVLAGHDHTNNFVINYKGITLAQALHLGMGSYWHQSLNGGTVIKINSDGIYDIYHEYVNVDHIVAKYEE